MPTDTVDSPAPVHDARPGAVWVTLPVEDTFGGHVDPTCVLTHADELTALRHVNASRQVHLVAVKVPHGTALSDVIGP